MVDVQMAKNVISIINPEGETFQAMRIGDLKDAELSLDLDDYIGTTKPKLIGG